MSDRQQHLGQDVIAEYWLVNKADGFWIDIRINGGQPYDAIGPFDTAQERDDALEDLLEMTRSLGAEDLPTVLQ